jgi:hypothetical protein
MHVVHVDDVDVVDVMMRYMYRLLSPEPTKNVTSENNSRPANAPSADATVNCSHGFILRSSL